LQTMEAGSPGEWQPWQMAVRLLSSRKAWSVSRKVPSSV